MSNIKDYSQKEDLEGLKLREIFEDRFLPALQEFDESLAPTRQKELTDKITALDSQRAKYFVGLNAHLRALKDFPDKTTADASIRLKHTIDKFGKNIHNLPLAEETAVLINILQELNQGEPKRDVALAGVLRWVEELQKVNEQFRTLFKERINKEASVEVGKGRASRERMQKVFTDYVQRINALIVIEGQGAYRTLVDNINREIERAKQVKKQSEGISKGSGVVMPPVESVSE